MSRPRKRARTVQNTAVLMAGWLFADLMLVLFMVGLGAQPTAYSAQPTSTPTATATPTKKPTSTRQPVLSKTPVKIKVRTSKNLAKQLNAGLKKHHLSADQAGMVLAWGDHEVISQGQEAARHVTDQLPRIDKQFFGKATMRVLWSGAGQADLVTLEIYVLK